MNQTELFDAAERVRADFPVGVTDAVWIVYRATELFGDGLAEAVSELAVVSGYRHGIHPTEVLWRLWKDETFSVVG